MTTRYGFEAAQWNKAREEARDVIIEFARKDEPRITYSELVSRIGAIPLEPDSYALAALLEEISRSEYEAGRGMLSVLGVNKADMMPGAGFFKLAGVLRKAVEDRETVFVSELNAVTSHWEAP